MAVLAIGDELLSGKIQDANLYYITGELRALGVSLPLAMFVPDDIQAIIDAIEYARPRADLLLTCGGVGPTHDDRTLAAVARAFGRELVPEPGLVEAIHAYYGERVNEDLLSMAQVPAGVDLLRPAPFYLPIFKVEEVHIFPGAPQALRVLFDAWKETLRQEPFHLIRLELDTDEGEVAPLLRDLEASHAGLSVGSYPRYDDGAPYRVLVTLESKDAAQVQAVADTLTSQVRERIGHAALIRLDSVHHDP